MRTRAKKLKGMPSACRPTERPSTGGKKRVDGNPYRCSKYQSTTTKAYARKPGSGRRKSVSPQELSRMLYG